MTKINFVNGQAPALNDVTLNQLQTNIENAITQAILEDNKKKYYVGKIIMDTANVNPATYLGFGTWQQWGQGRVPVGVDASDNDFNTVEKTGGEKKHTMTIEELVTHRHEYHVKNTQGAGNSRETAARGSSATGEDDWRQDPFTEYEGQSQPFNIQQQYITCYMWKRVA